MSTLGKNIRALRTMKGIRQTELAKVLDLQRSTVTKWETGAILSIRASHLDDLCAYYGLSKDDILSSDAGLAAQLAAANGEVDHSRSAGFVPLYELEYDDYLDENGFEIIVSDFPYMESWEKGNTRIVFESWIGGLWGYVHTEFIG
jgi:transcriptional regulator with XRE-family HTH domain